MTVLREDQMEHMSLASHMDFLNVKPVVDDLCRWQLMALSSKAGIRLSPLLCMARWPLWSKTTLHLRRPQHISDLSHSVSYSVELLLLRLCSFIRSFILSFIHYRDLYIISSRLLLRSAQCYRWEILFKL